MKESREVEEVEEVNERLNSLTQSGLYLYLYLQEILLSTEYRACVLVPLSKQEVINGS